MRPAASPISRSRVVVPRDVLQPVVKAGTCSNVSTCCGCRTGKRVRVVHQVSRVNRERHEVIDVARERRIAVEAVLVRRRSPDPMITSACLGVFEQDDSRSSASPERALSRLRLTWATQWLRANC